MPNPGTTPQALTGLSGSFHADFVVADPVFGDPACNVDANAAVSVPLCEQTFVVSEGKDVSGPYVARDLGMSVVDI